MKNLSGRTVLLTGATGGIGHAIARALHRRGAQLVLTGRRRDVLEPLSQELGARSLAVDLAMPDEVDRLIAEGGHVDVLVANAGLPAAGSLFSFSPKEIDRALAVNLRAPMMLARSLGEKMAERRGGHIVLISSLAGKVANPGSSVYAATKSGLRGFGRCLREDLHGTGVGVSVVFPGFVRDAGMFAEAAVELPRFVGTSTPDDVAQAVVVGIEHDRGELDVAPVGVKLGARFARMAPAVSARVQRRLGSDDVAEAMERGQSNKR